MYFYPLASCRCPQVGFDRVSQEMRPAISKLSSPMFSQANAHFILRRISSKSEEDMKPVPLGSLLLKATLAYLISSPIKHLEM